MNTYMTDLELAANTVLTGDEWLNYHPAGVNGSATNANGVTLAQAFEIDYYYGIELCKNHAVSAVEYLDFLTEEGICKDKTSDPYYFLILAKDIGIDQYS
jgi:hypothetical protein